MKTKCVRVEIPEERAVAFESALPGLTEAGFNSWQPDGSERVLFTIYPGHPNEAVRLSRQLREHLAGGREDAEPDWDVRVESLPEADWSTSWKAFFHVEHLSRRIVVKPTWASYRANPGECVIELDPGMSFGTGQHETTRGCLRFLDTLTEGHGNGSLSFLDLGCGSGILAIAADRLGCSPVLALDHDPDAVRIARENLAANGCAPGTDVILGDVADLRIPRRFDIVAANILAPVLIAHADAMVRTVADHGHLLLAGILTVQYPEVHRAYHDAGFKECERADDGEWTSARFQRAGELLASPEGRA